MGQKGSKYARKHLLTQTEMPAQKSAQPHQILKDKLSDDNRIIWDILCEPSNFEERFLNLSYPQQILMVVTLHDIVKNQESHPQRGTAAKFADMAEEHLEKIHFLTDSHIDNGDFEPLADDEKRIIRMDCYGKINKRPEHQLSPLYKYFTAPKNAAAVKFSDYDMKNSPSWRVFRQFESFRSIENKIKGYLYKKQINPDALKVMTVNDYCDVIYNSFKPDSENKAANFIDPQKNLRVRLVKDFMRHCGKQFEQQLIKKGNDPRCAISLCNAMRRFGHTDINTLIVTETNYTPRVLTDLERAGYDISDINVGDTISTAFTNRLIDENKGFLLLARNENGLPLDKSSLPKLELHHKRAVQFTASSGYLAKANYPHNMLLAEAMMHRNYYHLFDAVYKQNQMNNFYQRLNASSPYMVSILGFNEQDSIYYDFEKTISFKKREAEDKANVVNYMQEMEQRMQNEINIAEKYNIPYNNTAIQRSTAGLNFLTEKIGKNSENLQKFSKWLATQRKNNSRR